MHKKEKKPSPFKDDITSENDLTSLEGINNSLIDQINESNKPPPPPPGALVSQQQLLLRQKQELEKLFDVRHVATRLSRALSILKDHHVTCIDPEQNAARVAFAKQVSNQLQVKLPEELNTPHTFEEILCVPKEKIDAAYTVGKELFEKKYFSEACDVFFLLTQLNPYFANVWIAMGLCWQNQQNYDAALGSNAIAILLNDKNPEPYLYSIECYLSLKEQDQAVAMIELVAPVIKQHADHKAFQQRLLILKSQLK
jgi:tetratricopeptide (TPR) repeat protein